MSWVAHTGCDRCGDIVVDARDVLLASAPCSASQLVYRLSCPSCHVLLVQPVDALTVCALLSAGARWDDWKWPHELAEHPSDATAPPITEQDVGAFVKALTLMPTARERT